MGWSYYVAALCRVECARFLASGGEPERGQRRPMKSKCKRRAVSSPTSRVLSGRRRRARSFGSNISRILERVPGVCGVRGSELRLICQKTLRGRHRHHIHDELVASIHSFRDLDLFLRRGGVPLLMNRRDSRGAHGITTAITNRALQPGVSAHREPKWSTPYLRTHLLDKCNLQPWAAVAAAAAAAAAEAGAAAGAAVAAFDRCTRRSCRPWGDFLTSSLLRESRLLLVEALREAKSADLTQTSSR